jgi:hypothetical protein
MDRADKIFTILAFAGMIAVLLHTHRPRGHRGVLTGVKANTSDMPDGAKPGPVYLLSNLPSRRLKDDYADPSSYFTAEGVPYSPDVWGHGEPK